MARKDRDYEVILKGCESFRLSVECARRGAALLKKEALISENTLKDRISRKNIDTITQFADIVIKKTAVGEERIRELERQIRREERDVKDMENER